MSPSPERVRHHYDTSVPKAQAERLQNLRKELSPAMHDSTISRDESTGIEDVQLRQLRRLKHMLVNADVGEPRKATTANTMDAIYNMMEREKGQRRFADLHGRLREAELTGDEDTASDLAFHAIPEAEAHIKRLEQGNGYVSDLEVEEID